MSIVHVDASIIDVKVIREIKALIIVLSIFMLLHETYITDWRINTTTYLIESSALITAAKVMKCFLSSYPLPPLVILGRIVIIASN